jgi:predicted phosphodiesterase
MGRVLFFNPGYAGKQRFELPRSVAVLHCDEQNIRPEYARL